MHKIKFLSWITRLEEEAKDLIIGNSMIGHSLEIELNLRKLKNVSIVEKMDT